MEIKERRSYFLHAPWSNANFKRNTHSDIFTWVRKILPQKPPTHQHPFSLRSNQPKADSGASYMYLVVPSRGEQFMKNQPVAGNTTCPHSFFGMHEFWISNSTCSRYAKPTITTRVCVVPPDEAVTPAAVAPSGLGMGDEAIVSVVFRLWNI